MTIFWATWSAIVGLALMLVGGLVLWAYGGRRPLASRPVAEIGAETGPEAEATRHFHQRLARWFFVYGSTVTTIGIGLLFWAAVSLLGG